MPESIDVLLAGGNVDGCALLTQRDLTPVPELLCRGETRTGATPASALRFSQAALENTPVGPSIPIEHRTFNGRGTIEYDQQSLMVEATTPPPAVVEAYMRATDMLFAENALRADAEAWTSLPADRTPYSVLAELDAVRGLVPAVQPANDWVGWDPPASQPPIRFMPELLNPQPAWPVAAFSEALQKARPHRSTPSFPGLPDAPDLVKYLIPMCEEGFPTGSRTVCTPPVMDTDIDYVVLPKNFSLFLKAANTYGYSRKTWHDGCDKEKYVSLYNGDINLIVIRYRDRFNRFRLATKVACRLNILDRDDRHYLFNSIIDGLNPGGAQEIDI